MTRETPNVVSKRRKEGPEDERMVFTDKKRERGGRKSSLCGLSRKGKEKAKGGCEILLTGHGQVKPAKQAP